MEKVFESSSLKAAFGGQKAMRNGLTEASLKMATTQRSYQVSMIKDALSTVD